MHTSCLDGLTDARQAFFRKANNDRSLENIAALHGQANKDGVTLRQYLRDVPIENRDIMSPPSPRI